VARARKRFKPVGFGPAAGAGLSTPGIVDRGLI
jgi:hypothetical protein